MTYCDDMRYQRLMETAYILKDISDLDIYAVHFQLLQSGLQDNIENIKEVLDILNKYWSIQL